jgi:Ca-activated chloride channel family protein
VVVFFFNPIGKKKQTNLGELIKKLSPDRSVFKPIFKLVVILLALRLIFDWSIQKLGLKWRQTRGIDIVFMDVSKVCLQKMLFQPLRKKVSRLFHKSSIS